VNLVLFVQLNYESIIFCYVQHVERVLQRESTNLHLIIVILLINLWVTFGKRHYLYYVQIKQDEFSIRLT
jgi:hypothetical protein